MQTNQRKDATTSRIDFRKLALAGAISSLALCGPALATTFTVNNTGDGSDANAGDNACATSSSGCTLRAALEEANAHAGSDVINFNISGSGVKTISPASGLTQITEAVTINGTTQPGFAGTPLIQINGTNAGGVNGIDIATSNCLVKGLLINRFASGSGVFIAGSNNTVQGCYLGIDATGSFAQANSVGVGILGGSANLIGGTTAAARNIISGNAYGANLFSGTSDNLVQGNYIGINPAGTGSIANTTDGVLIENSAQNNTIGGTTAGARNIISGNGRDGVRITGGGTNSNLVQGNYIGTNTAGTAAQANGGNGVRILLGAQGNTIGGTTSAERNVISGNGSNGVWIGDDGSSFPTCGINNIDTTDNVVQGNYIGTNAAGMAGVPNASHGVFLIGVSNVDDGCYYVAANTFNNIVGGTATGEGNVIAFNGGAGVAITSNDAYNGGFSSATRANLIRGNSIHDNTGIGIDLGADGVTANDANDSDDGPNHFQNFPVVSSVAYASGTNKTTVSGVLDSAPNKSYLVDVYRNTAADPAANSNPAGGGEGETYLGQVSAPVNTNASGHGTWTFSLTGDFSSSYFSATATDTSTLDTSEFCKAVTGGPPPLVPVFISDVSMREGDVGKRYMYFSVSLGQPSLGTVSVDYATSDGTAVAPGAYASRNSTATFAPGETSKLIAVPINGNTRFQPDITFTVNLSNPVNAIITDGQGIGTIVNDDPDTRPTISIDDVTLSEGNSGMTNFTFHVTLSAAASQTVSVTAQTADGTAVAPGDYTARSAAVVSFTAGQTSKTFTVQVKGDAVVEPNETFLVNLSSPSGASIADGQGVGTITNDDASE